MQLAQPTAAVARCRPRGWRCATLAPVRRASRAKSTGPVSVSDDDLVSNVAGCVGFLAVWDFGLCPILISVRFWAMFDFGLCPILVCVGFWAVWDFGVCGIMGCLGFWSVWEYAMTA